MPPDRAVVCHQIGLSCISRRKHPSLTETPEPIYTKRQTANIQEFAESKETNIHAERTHNTRSKLRKDRGGSYRRWQCQASRHTRCIRTKQQQYLTWIYSAGPSQYTPGKNRHHQTKLTMGQDTSEVAHDNFIQGQDISSYKGKNRISEPLRLSEPSV